MDKRSDDDAAERHFEAIYVATNAPPSAAAAAAAIERLN